MLRPALVLLLALPLAASELAVLAPEHPRAFFFRTSEGIARSGRVTYERWNAEYSRLHGIIGKCLDEEIPGTMKQNPAWFTRFKREHPEQVVLLHFNGNANDPLFGPGHWFPGHWIHRAATGITKDIPAEPGESVIHVEDSRDFKTATGRYRNINDDIALFGITKDGKHRWSRCEQVQLLSVDHAKNTITVRRGCYGTKPLGFIAGQSRAAAHQVEGPWGQNNHLLWFYNFTGHCPKDPNGKTATDVLVDRFAEWFGPGGPLEALDGVEFDVMHHVTRGDTTGDGVMDHGVIDGRNRYGTGVVEFARQLRKRMGPGFIIQGDGALGTGGLRSQRAFQILNGIESEGFPNLNDWDFDDWSGGLNRHSFWIANAHPPAFSYVNHKWIQPVPGGKPGQKQSPKVPFSRHRLSIAGTIFTDSVFTYAYTPNRGEKRMIGIYDELVAGTENKKAWLGKATGPAIHLATREPDLLGGIQLRRRIRGEVRTKELKDGILVQPAPRNAAAALRFSIPDIPADGPDLLVTVTMSGNSPDHWPEEMARSAQVGVNSGTQALFPPFPETTGMQLRGKPEQDLDRETGASIRYVRSLKFVSDCGPKDNTTTDQSFWAAVRVVSAGCDEDKFTRPESRMTWLDGDPFTSTFYFRDIRSKKVDLTFEIEHCLPVTIHSLAAHAAPDLMMREFEHGLVLANPSHREQIFDLQKLTPGQSFRRIQGRPEQDPKTNNGQPVGKSITLGERDAIFLRRSRIRENSG